MTLTALRAVKVIPETPKALSGIQLQQARAKRGLHAFKVHAGPGGFSFALRAVKVIPETPKA